LRLKAPFLKNKQTDKTDRALGIGHWALGSSKQLYIQEKISVFGEGGKRKKKEKKKEKKKKKNNNKK